MAGSDSPAPSAGPSAPVAPRLPWRVLSALALRWWVVSRIGTALVVWGAGTLFAKSGAPAASLTRGAITPVSMLGRLNVWDAAIFYLPIALHGYTRQAQVAFWPLYPALIHVGLWLSAPWGRLDTTHALIVALVISNLATLATFLAVAALVYHETRRRVFAERAVQALALSPFAFWLALPYSDSLYLALATFALVALRRQQWWRVAFFAYWAALARPTSAALALVVGAVLLVEMVHWVRRWRGSPSGSPSALREHKGQRAAVTRTLVPRGAALLSAPLGAALWLGASAYAFPQWGGWRAPLQATSQVFGYHFSLGGGMASLREMGAALAAAPHLSFATSRLLLDAAPWVVSAALCAIACVGLPTRRAHQRIGRTGRTGRTGQTGRIAWPLALYAVAVTLISIWSPLEHQLFTDPMVAAGRFALAAAPLLLTWVALTTRQPSRSGSGGGTHGGTHGGVARWLRTLEWAAGPLLQALLLLFLLLGGWLV